MCGLFYCYNTLISEFLALNGLFISISFIFWIDVLFTPMKYRSEDRIIIQDGAIVRAVFPPFQPTAWSFVNLLTARWYWRWRSHSGFWHHSWIAISSSFAGKFVALKAVAVRSMANRRGREAYWRLEPCASPQLPRITYPTIKPLILTGKGKIRTWYVPPRSRSEKKGYSTSCGRADPAYASPWWWRIFSGPGLGVNSL